MNFVQCGERIGNGLVSGGFAELLHLDAVALAVGQAACAAHTAADTGHALDKVGVQHVLALLEQSHAALLDAVAGDSLQGKVGAMLLQTLCYRVGQTAAAGKNAAEIGGVVQSILLQSSDVDVTAVEQSLQLLKGDDPVNPGLDFFLLHLSLLGGTGTHKNHDGVGVCLFDVFADGSHGGQIVGHILGELGESPVDVLHKGGTAGAGEETPLASSADSAKATMSAPRAASMTVWTPISFRPLMTWPSLA